MYFNKVLTTHEIEELSFILWKIHSHIDMSIEMTKLRNTIINSMGIPPSVLHGDRRVKLSRFIKVKVGDISKEEAEKYLRDIINKIKGATK